MNWLDLFDKGGIIVWVLAGYSVLGLSIVLERWLYYTWRGGARRNLETRIQASLSSGDFSTWRKRSCEYAIVFAMFNAAKTGVKDLARVGARIQSAELHRLERGLATLGLLGNTAPLLGLLGTIIGMIKAFMVIEQAGGKVDAAALAGGIWEAMLTTGVGLVIAIPLLILLHLLENSVESRAQNMQQALSLVLEQNSHHNNTPVTEPQAHHWQGIGDE